MCISQFWRHRPRLRPIRCRFPCHRTTRWCSAATFISSRHAAWRRPRRRPFRDQRCRRRSTSISLTTQWNRGTYVHVPPHTRRAILFASLYHIPIPGRDVSLCPPYQGFELLQTASLFKQRREIRTLRSAVPSAAFLFVVVVGPSDLGPCLTDSLHYNRSPQSPARGARQLFNPNTDEWRGTGGPAHTS